jgi:hypothetical protein
MSSPEFGRTAQLLVFGHDVMTSMATWQVWSNGPTKVKSQSLKQMLDQARLRRVIEVFFPFTSVSHLRCVKVGESTRSMQSVFGLWFERQVA